MKNLITSALLLMALLLPATATAYDFEVDGIYYDINGNEATVTYMTTDYKSYSGDVTIPSAVTYDGMTYSVTAIGCRGFYNCFDLTSVIIPNSVTSIGDEAFWACYKLTSINLPNSVTHIGVDAFCDCCSLTSISIPSSVTTISDGAFQGCNGLQHIVIPNSVTSIGVSVFFGCSGLTSLIVDSGNPNYDSRDDCNAIIETSSNKLIAGCQNTVIPNSVCTIDQFAFGGCSELTSVIIPNSVTSIGDYAFEVCRGLKSVTIPNSVISIGDGAFALCKSLTSVSIPNSVISIGDGAFSECNNLSSIIVDSGNPIYDSRNDCNAIIETATNTLIAGCMNTIIPNSIITIGKAAFCYRIGLTSVDIPSSVITISYVAFYGCEGLTSVTIPKSVTTIANSAFRECGDLTDVYCYIVNPSAIFMGNDVFYLASSDYSGRTLHVPYGTAKDYRADERWYSYFGSIVEMDHLLGDVNGDGEVNIADINALIDIILGGDGNTTAADVNNDGEVNIADFNALIDIILGGDDVPTIPDGHEYVDLGLPSGTLWATCNIGANSPEEYGDYFAWGETEPKEVFVWSTYKWCNGSQNTLTKYCTDSIHGTVDNKIELALEDDAAFVNFGSSWRMPTLEQQEELHQQCTCTWTTVNGVNGQLFTGPNGNTLFLPASGYQFGNSLSGVGTYAYYWSRSLYSDTPCIAYSQGFGSSYMGWCGSLRSYGHTIRAVRASH